MPGRPGFNSFVLLNDMNNQLKDVKLDPPNASDVLQQIMKISDVYPRLLLTPLKQFARSLPAFSAGEIVFHPDRDEYAVGFLAKADWQVEGYNTRAKDGHLLFEPPFSKSGVRFYNLKETELFDVKHIAMAAGGSNRIPKSILSLKAADTVQILDKSGVRVHSFALIRARASGYLHLGIKGMRSYELLKMLRDNGWNGNQILLEEVFAAYDLVHRPVNVGINFDRRITDRLSIIVEQQPANILPQLYQYELLSFYQYQWLANWERTIELPVYLQDSLRDLHQRKISLLHTSVKRVEFIIDQSLLIKAYLGYTF